MASPLLYDCLSVDQSYGRIVAFVTHECLVTNYAERGASSCILCSIHKDCILVFVDIYLL